MIGDVSRTNIRLTLTRCEHHGARPGPELTDRPDSARRSGCHRVSPVLAGYMLGNHYHDRSLINLVDANRHGRLKAALAEQLIQIPESSVSLLPGLVHSAQADAMRPVWGPLGVHLAGLSVDDTNVIVDAGRIGQRGAPVELIVNATTIAIVTRTERTAIAALRASQNALRQQLSAVQSRASLG